MDRPCILHVVDPDAAASVADLLAGCTATRVVTTSPGPPGHLALQALRHRVRAVVAHGDGAADATALVAERLRLPWALHRPDASTGAVPAGCRLLLTPLPHAAPADDPTPDDPTPDDPTPRRLLAPCVVLPSPGGTGQGVAALGAVPGLVEGAPAATHAEAALVVAGPGAAPGDLLAAQARGRPLLVLTGADPLGVAAPGSARAELDGAGLSVARLLADPDGLAALGAAARAHVLLRHERGAVAADLDEQLHALAHGHPAPAVAPPRPELPTVTVLVPTFRRRELLSRALEALQAQTYPRHLVQLVVVDNGSGDGSADQARDVAEVVTLPENAFVPTARNAGLRRATGEIVAFTDDDCRPVPTWLESLVAGFREGVGLVQGRTTADPEQDVPPLARSQWTPCEFGLYETANIAYTAEALGLPGQEPFRSDLPEALAGAFGDRFRRDPFGEDVELGWRVRRSGARTRFAVDAVVHHHVFPPDADYLLRRARVTAGFPLLVRRVPELRRTFLLGGVALGKHRLGFYGLLLGVLSVLRGRPLRAAALAAPYFWMRVRPTRGGREGRIRALPVQLRVDLAETRALAEGNVRARGFVI